MFEPNKNDNSRDLQDSDLNGDVEMNDSTELPVTDNFQPKRMPDSPAQQPDLWSPESNVSSAKLPSAGLGTGAVDHSTGRHQADRPAQFDEPIVREVIYHVSPAEAESSSMLEPPIVEPLSVGKDEDNPADSENETSGWKTAWAIVREVGETVILTLIIFLLIQMVVRNFRVVGTSMVSNLQDGQYLIIDKVSYNPWITEYLGIGGLQRGDVIVFEPPRRPEEDYVKRVIGLPGEKVQVIKGEVLINDQPLDEPFEPTIGSYTMPEPVTVPSGQVFVLGDNRNNSNDSHNWGPLPIENIVGRAWISYWPPDLWGTIPRDGPTEEATLKHLMQQVIPSANASNE